MEFFDFLDANIHTIGHASDVNRVYAAVFFSMNMIDYVV